MMIITIMITIIIMIIIMIITIIIIIIIIINLNVSHGRNLFCVMGPTIFSSNIYSVKHLARYT